MFGSKIHLSSRNNHLFIEDVDCAFLAEKFGTPLYVTSESRLKENFRTYHRAFPDAEKYFAVKANGNLAILRILAREGAGADVFSSGELSIVSLAGISKEKILFNGNSKRWDEHIMAMEAGVRISVDSHEELDLLSQVASKKGHEVEVFLRINPDISPKTHPKIATGLKTSKFGIASEDVAEMFKRAMQLPGVEPVGLHCHIGSQILDVLPFAETMQKMMDIANSVVDIGGEIRFLDIGGGLGIQYMPDVPAKTPDDLAKSILPIFDSRCKEIGIHPKLILEPGRSIVADTTIMLTGVNLVKRAHVNFAAVDAGFNTLARPMLYDAYHHVVAVNKADEQPRDVYTVVGPICETGDILAKDRRLPEIGHGDVLAFLDAGAYGFSMASQYNGQPRPAEVLVSGSRAEIIREAEDHSTLLAGQRIPARLL
ncbi:MAG: diaminopimelate decarboxylase [Methanotrichaceae archaeon]|nr:diaminopimelate decarboxylase [Methanotrichaceae archaeon]